MEKIVRPATPLPWDAQGAMNSRDVLIGKGSNGSPIQYGQEVARVVLTEAGVVHGTSDPKWPDAAYIVHAANAYPRLVEMLASFLRAPSIGSSGPGSITLEVQSFNREAAAAFLRELGEAE